MVLEEIWVAERKLLNDNLFVNVCAEGGESRVTTILFSHDIHEREEKLSNNNTVPMIVKN